MMETVTVQYLPCGHVDWSADPKHIQLSKERAEQGYLDALILPTAECEECKEERDRQDRLHRYYGLSLDD